MAMSDSYEPYTLGKILMEALKLLPKSMKLTFPISIFTFVYSSSLFITNTSYTSPLLQDLTSKLLLILNKEPNGPLGPGFMDNLIAIGKDLKQLIIIEAISSFVSFIIVLLLLISLAYTFSTAYSDKPLSVKGLVKIIDKRWYETLITKLYIVLLSLGYGVFMGSIIGVVMLITKSSNLSMSLAYFALCLYIYLFTRWQLSLLVTVNEKAYGLGALSEAVILYIGNMKIGCAITYLALLVQCAIYGAFLFIQKSMKVDNLIGIELGFLALSLMWNIYILAVYTVYYFECRKSHGIVDHEEGDQSYFKYWSLLPSTTKV
ncbi:hypothetical protein J5N97_026815 [Dioscorea zingiberensis]|uniref:Transmembrane protein n=1 Tax=Dioscorea zingiberensis TaxID=325984 RepID=A0A9D5C2W4_9LILI|nr:hypothetical protein J5N97_026815 [Dioscorea zingiberensis]